MSDFEGRHVVVTGGTGALGVGVINRLLAAGATCHVVHLHDQSVVDFPYLHRVNLHKVDCTNGRMVTGFFHALTRLDASIHLVGGFHARDLVNTSIEEFQTMMNVNALTCFLCCREAVRKMRGLKTPGRIVNVAAKPVLQPAGGMVSYTTSKAAVLSMTRCLAEELKGEGFLVNAVVPSIMDTPANRKASPEARHDTWPSVEQVADAITFLAGPRNTVTTGAAVPVGGMA